MKEIKVYMYFTREMDIPLEPTPQVWFNIGRDLLKMESEKELEDQLTSYMSPADVEVLVSGVYDEDVARSVKGVINKIYMYGRDIDEIDRILEANGCLWISYIGIGFVNCECPLYKASIGAIPLTPNTFYSGCPPFAPLKLGTKGVLSKEHLGEVLLRRCRRGRGYGTEEGWRNESLRNAIIDLGLHEIGTDEEKLRSVLNFKLLTGMEKDAEVALPSLGLHFYPQTHPYWKKFTNICEGKEDDDSVCLAFWRKVSLGKIYYLNVYTHLCRWVEKKKGTHALWVCNHFILPRELIDIIARNYIALLKYTF
jgi:hypothetical protein